jgi:hypothetical protein
MQTMDKPFIATPQQPVMMIKTDNLLRFSVVVASAFCIFLFLKRLPYPDVDFDTINYHLYLGKAGYYFFPWSFSPQEFYPLGLHQFNPLIDTLGYIFYDLLGYRLGTVSSLLPILGFFICMALVLKRLLPRVLGLIPALLLISVCTPLLLVNQGLLQIATYLVDNTYLCLLAGALLLLMSFNAATENKRGRYLIGFSVLMGLLATKLVNLIYVIPLALLFFNEYWLKLDQGANRARGLASAMIVSAMVVSVINYHYIWSWHQSENPFFPYYNALFQSPYYPPENWPFNYGPKGLAQRLLYPYFAITQPELLSEIKGVVVEQRIVWVFLVNLLLLGCYKACRFALIKPVRQVFVLYVISYVLWQILFGYNRYGMFVDVIGLTLALVLLINMAQKLKGAIVSMVMVIIGFVSLGFGLEVAAYNVKHDASWRPKVSWSQWLNEVAKGNLMQRNTEVAAPIQALLEDVDLVLRCGNPSTAYVVTVDALKTHPMLNIGFDQTKAMTTNQAWQIERDRRFLSGVKDPKKDSYKFAAVVNKDGGPDAGRSLRQCLRSIAKTNEAGQRIEVEQQIDLDNFVGDTTHTLQILIGAYYPRVTK